MSGLLQFLGFGVLCGLAGYGLAVFGGRCNYRPLRDYFVEYDDEAERDEVSEPYGGRNVVPVTSAADLSNVTVTVSTVSVLPVWVTLYARDE